MRPLFLNENAVVMQRASCSRHQNFPSVIVISRYCVSRYSYSAVKVRGVRLPGGAVEPRFNFTVRKTNKLLKTNRPDVICRAD